jgi:hypothetical protein
MFDNAPSIRIFLKVALQILLAIMTGAVASLIMKFTVVSVILSLVELSEIQTHALKGLASLLSFSLGYWVYVKFYEKRKTVELAFSGLNMLYGTLLGSAIILITILPLFALGYYQIVSYQTFNEVFFAFIGLTTQAIFGVILFTGIFFRLIEPHLGTKYSLLSLSVLLGLLNILVDGPDVVVLLSIILINALWFSIYVLSRNLWVAGLANGTWLCAVFSTGILDEHWRASAPIVSSYNGPVLITGGEFGPEHSVITIVIVSICLFLILRLARQKDLFVKV